MSNQELQSKRTCQKCGSILTPDSAFCTTCGTPVPKMVQPQRQAFEFCVYCGSKYPVGDMFCQNCGKKTIQGPAPAAAPTVNKEEHDKSQYEYALKLLEEKRYEQALPIFNRLGDYSDSKAKARECIDARENARKEKIYASSIAMISAPNITDVEMKKAIDALKSIADYKDSKDKVVELETRLKKFLEAKDLARKEFVYNKSVAVLNAPAANDLQIKEAIAAFKSLGEFKDSPKKVTETEARLEKWYKDKAAFEEAERIRKAKAKAKARKIVLTHQSPILSTIWAAAQNTRNGTRK